MRIAEAYIIINDDDSGVHSFRQDAALLFRRIDGQSILIRIFEKYFVKLLIFMFLYAII